MRPHRLHPTRLLHPWDSPGKNTGVGCHFLLQCMKVKSESEVVHSCSTLCDLMDCSLPGSSIHGIFQTRVLEWGASAFSGLWFYTWSKMDPRLSCCQDIAWWIISTSCIHFQCQKMRLILLFYRQWVRRGRKWGTVSKEGPWAVLHPNNKLVTSASVSSFSSLSWEGWLSRCFGHGCRWIVALPLLMLSP